MFRPPCAGASSPLPDREPRVPSLKPIPGPGRVFWQGIGLYFFTEQDRRRLSWYKRRLNHARLCRRSRGRGIAPGRTFGILCWSVSEIAEADSTSVFRGLCPAPGSTGMTLGRIYRLLYKSKRRCPAYPGRPHRFGRRSPAGSGVSGYPPCGAVFRQPVYTRSAANSRQNSAFCGEFG
jgi:hypothetical protein